jgi:radical SAM superfamily enzyme YgiQ (UPF0313 family)
MLTLKNLGKVLLVDTAPRRSRGSRSFNVGFDIVKNYLSADTCHYKDIINSNKYDTIAFNVFYPLNMLNIKPFLDNNTIKQSRYQKIIAGGKGIWHKNQLIDILDYVHPGEVDEVDNHINITSYPSIHGNKAIIELTRGCKYHCKFCQYGQYQGGKYREREISSLLNLLHNLQLNGINTIKFISVNFAGYTHIKELLDYCRFHKLRITNTNNTIIDLHRITSHIDVLPNTISLGIESFNFNTRSRINKNFNDTLLYTTLDYSIKNFSHLHLYLIYGLPGDNYVSWFTANEIIGNLMKKHTNSTCHYNNHKVRLNYSISTFQPEPGTPFEGYDYPNFHERKIFLDKFIQSMRANSIINTQKNVTPDKLMGFFGLSEYTYKVLMTLKGRDISTINNLIELHPNGFPGRLQYKKSVANLLNIK